MVPGAGLEPARDKSRGILSPLRLPIPPPGLYRETSVSIVEARNGIEPMYAALQAAA